MSWITTHKLPTLRSYAECEAFFNKTPLPRSINWRNTPSARPLEHTSMPHKAIVKHQALEGQLHSYGLRLYTKTLVEYLENGAVVINNDDRAGSRAFIGRFLPPGVHCFSRRRETWFSIPTERGRIYITGDGLTLRSAGPETYIAFGFSDRRREFFNRSRMAQVAYMWDEFDTWVRASLRVSGNNGLDRTAIASAIQRITDRNTWPDLIYTWFLANLAKDPRRRFEELVGARETRTIDSCLPPKRQRLSYLS